MNFQIFCKVFVLVLFVLATGSSPAHSVYDNSHDHDHVHGVQVDEHSAKSVDELIEEYARTGDDGLIAQAWRILMPQFEKADATVWLRAAWLAQSEHNFDGALQYLDKMLSLKPRHGVALLLKANTAAVTGNVNEARSACRQTFGVVEPVVTQACLARLAQGKSEQITALRRLQAWPEVNLDARFQAWVVETIALLAAENGELKTAEAAYKRALQLNPSVALNAAYADVLLAQDRPIEVLELISSAEATPALALRRLLAANALKLDLDTELAAIDRQFRGWYRKGDFRHAREMALFYLFVLPDPQLAKELTEVNFKSQKESIDVELARYVGFQF